MANVRTQLDYDLKRMCSSGDIGIQVTYYPKNDTAVSTYVILKTAPSITDDSRVNGTVLTGVILKADVSTPRQGDTFYDATNKEEYRVIEFVDQDDAFATAIVEKI